MRAIEFYQKIGFQLIMVYPDAVNYSRKLKNEIPLIAENGIPIRDELEFVLQLSP
jgi:predicted regulator of amino acid metabolism with ACT domain